MIAVTRGRSRDDAAQRALVAGLAALHEQELPKIRRIRASGRLESKHFKSDQAVRHALYDDQYGKCCYCERYGSKERDHLEHFRPKARAERSPGHSSGEGYYWLAWTWSNLLFACGDCNLQKNTRFPLAHGCVPLEPEAAPPGSEHAWLLDPAAFSDPFDHIQFRPVDDPSGTRRWRPVPRGGSYYGYWTIKTLGLDRPGLLDRYGKHVRLRVAQAVAAIRNAADEANATGDPAHVRAVWDQRLAWLCDPEQEFIALSCDVLDHHFPRVFRRRWGLCEPRPHASAPSASA